MGTKDLFPRAPLSIPVEFLYRVSYKAKSWTNERQEFFVGRTDVVLASAPMEDMPVVYRLKSEKPEYRDEFSAPFATGDWVDVRFHENRFYVEHDTLESFVAKLRDGHPDKTHFSWLHTPNQRFEKSVRGRDGTYAKIEVGHEIHDVVSIRRKQDGIRYVTDDLGESVIEEIRSFASELLVADGRVFRAVAEPVVHLNEWDASFQESTDEYHHSRHRHLFSTKSMLPLSRFGEVSAQLKRKGGLEAEVLRPDLVLVHANLGLDLAAIWESVKSYGKLMHEMPRDWAVALARLNRTLDGSPLHPTPAILDALEAVHALPLPTEDEFARLGHLSTKNATFRESRMHDPATQVRKTLAELKAKIPGWRESAHAFLADMPLKDRTDSSFNTIMPSRMGENVGARVRPARSLSDLRSAAEIAGSSYADFMERISDEGLDVLVAEGRWSNAPAPGEWIDPVVVAIFDRETRTVVDSFAKHDDFVAAGQRAMDAHIERLAAREPEFSRSAGMTP